MLSPDLYPLGQEAAIGPVIRGGCWISSAANCRSAYHDGNSPGNRFNDVGFRLSRGQ